MPPPPPLDTYSLPYSPRRSVRPAHYDALRPPFPPLPGPVPWPAEPHAGGGTSARAWSPRFSSSSSLVHFPSQGNVSFLTRKNLMMLFFPILLLSWFPATCGLKPCSASGLTGPSVMWPLRSHWLRPAPLSAPSLCPLSLRPCPLSLPRPPLHSWHCTWHVRYLVGEAMCAASHFVSVFLVSSHVSS